MDEATVEQAVRLANKVLGLTITRSICLILTSPSTPKIQAQYYKLFGFWGGAGGGGGACGRGGGCRRGGGGGAGEGRFGAKRRCE